MDDLLISGIQHYIFCPRQWALIHIEQQWKDNFLTTHGSYLHKKTDNPEVHERRKDLIILHALQVRSNELGLHGVCDTVEFHKSEEGVFFSRWDGYYKIYPIEYKRGKKKIEDSDVMQLLAQTICLEEMTATRIDEGAIFYFQTRRRERIEFTTEQRERLRKIVYEMHDLMNRHRTPKAKRKPKCRSCSLREICLPNLGNLKSASLYMKRSLEEE